MEAERHMLIRRERAQNVRTVGGAEQKKNTGMISERDRLRKKGHGGCTFGSTDVTEEKVEIAIYE